MKIPVYKTQGIILRRFNAIEFDKLLVVYAREFGKILIKAKSLRKKEAKMKESLELFNSVELLLAKGKNMDTITGVVVENSFLNLKSHLPSLAAAYYISELLDKLIVGPERDERIWQLILKAFGFLEERQRNSETIKKLLQRFEYNLLALLGHEPVRNALACEAGGLEQKQASYLDLIQMICGERIESRNFLSDAIKI